jgi:cadmium resistance protein CadD (predicted permease)
VLTTVGLAVAVFVATNVDDILLLAALFADRRLRPRSIIGGQLLGMTLLVGASGVCSLASLLVPPEWIALLGLAPLAMGLWLLPELIRGSREDDEQERELGAEQRVHSQLLAVALVTVANGGDNLAVYIPLFAGNSAALPVYAAVLLLLTGVWCGLGYLLVNNRLIGERVRRQGRVALPLVLIALGLFILSDARPLLERAVGSINAGSLR